MTKIDFYVLTSEARGNRYTTACRLATKAYQQGRRIFMHVDSDQDAIHLDRLLWTLDEQGFVPHGLSGKVDATLNPILIGNGYNNNEEHDVLINLATEVPTFFSRFQRLAECVDNDNNARTASRTRFKFYRDRGYPLQTHEIG